MTNRHRGSKGRRRRKGQKKRPGREEERVGVGAGGSAKEKSEVGDRRGGRRRRRERRWRVGRLNKFGPQGCVRTNKGRPTRLGVRQGPWRSRGGSGTALRIRGRDGRERGPLSPSLPSFVRAPWECHRSAVTPLVASFLDPEAATRGNPGKRASLRVRWPGTAQTSLPHRCSL